MMPAPFGAGNYIELIRKEIAVEKRQAYPGPSVSIEKVRYKYAENMMRIMYIIMEKIVL